MSSGNDSKPANSDDAIRAPAPTIVGPRPDPAAGAALNVPRGMEKLLTLAGLNEDWKRKALADPLRTAAEANIPLSPSESVILRTIPSQTLGQMILSFARNRLAPFKETALATGTAAAALLATTGCDNLTATDGIRPDTPPPRPSASKEALTAIQWETSLEAALAQASASNRAVMVVCPSAGKRVSKHVGPPGSRGIMIELPASPFLTELCKDGNNAVAQAIAAAGLIAVKPPPNEDHETYIHRLEKLKVKDDAPLVLFLAPDGSVLRKLAQPTREAKLVQAIQAVPPLLADWIMKKSQPVIPAPPATKGLNPR